MTFLTPGLAILAAGIGVPALVLLHVLRLRRVPQRVPSTLLWRRSVQDLEANVPFQRLRVSLLFVLQMLALICAALAAGQPLLRGHEAPASLAIVLDTRARMGALEREGPAPSEKGTAPFSEDRTAPFSPISRFERAKERARAAIRDRASAETQVHLIAARATPGLVASGSTGAILDALERMSPSDEPGDADAAMALAAEVAPDGELLWVGDAAGAREDNIGITVLSAQRSAREPGTVDVLVSAINSGSEPVDASLIVTIDGATQAARVLRIPAAAARPGELGRATAMLRVPEQPGALLEARLASNDALAIDDRAAMRFAPPTPIRVAFLTSDDSGAELSPLLALLSVMDSVRVERFPCNTTREALPRSDLIVADGCVPAVLASPDLTTPWLVFARSDAGASADTLRRRGVVLGGARSHPVLQGVPALTVDVALPSVASGTDALPPGAIPLLADRDEVLAFIDARAPGVRFLFPLSATDWPADPSWVMTMQNIVQWLVGDDGESSNQAIRTGVATRVLTEQRDGSRAWLSIAPQRRVDAIEVRSPDGVSTTHPVSLLDEVQSDLRFTPAPSDPRPFEQRASRRPLDDPMQAGQRALWPWFAFAALLLLAIEWGTYLVVINRRSG